MPGQSSELLEDDVRARDEGARCMVRMHVLPMAEADARLGDRSRLEALAPELRRRRQGQEVLRQGDVVRQGDLDFVVVKCEPPECRLGADTDYYVDGSPLVRFERIQFSGWGPVERSTEELFSDLVMPYFKGDYEPYSSTSKCVRLFYTSQMFDIDDVSFQVEATEPAGLGVVTKETEIFVVWDETPEFDKVHIVPFQDTLPRAYEFDIFEDYLKPHLAQNYHKKFTTGELFMYHGVQFKVVAVEPEAVSRIGRKTEIYCEGVLHPSLRNLLPAELLGQVAQLPIGLQMFLLNTERTTRELEDMLTQPRGLFEETLAKVERFTWPPPSAQESSQSTCMICLADFSLGDDCRRLPCRHVFHGSCVDEWLRRCTDCPICKDNVDRAIRHY